MPQTRALLLSDIADSTRLLDQLGDAGMAALWATHDRVARDLLPAHNGREIDKTDGFLHLFEQASDAVEYAVAYHRALRELDPPIRARVGIHVGDVILSENAPADVEKGAKPLEVDGIAKPTAARVMGLAIGGQTLITPQTLHALGDTSYQTESHGFWRMKGVSTPTELFEIGDQDAPFVPPPDGAKVYRVVQRQDGPWLPAREVPHTLPAERDAFVGRHADLLELARYQDEAARLVSVLGVGGTGKTRLVIRHGWTWLGDFPGGVWFCDLSEARSIDGITHAVARALDVPLGTADAVDQLGHVIAGRGRCLVILDNLEQVARFAEPTLGRWLDLAHEARFVATTREVLGLRGEQTLALAPMDLESGVSLFEARGKAALRSFELTDENREDVSKLVQMLDGLPLAIELAAARVRLMAPRTLVARMGQRFRLLASSGGRRDRQATLRATLDWSWDLLSQPEQHALAQLSVFEGGFSLEATEAVIDLEALDDAPWPMDAVQSLVDKSLVRRVSDDRLDLLVSVQVYAAARLEELGMVAAIHRRHGDWAAGLGDPEGLKALHYPRGAPLKRALHAELENLVAACRRAVADNRSETAVAAFSAAWRVLGQRGPYEVAVELAAQIAALPHPDPVSAARARFLLGCALKLRGRSTEAMTALEQAKALAAQTDDRLLKAEIMGTLAGLTRQLGRLDRAFEMFQALLPELEATGDPHMIGMTVFTLGVLNLQKGHPEPARALLERAIRIAENAGDVGLAGKAPISLGVLNHREGRLDEAEACYARAIAAARAANDRTTLTIVLGNLANLLSETGREEEARARIEEGLATAREIGNLRSQAILVSSLGGKHRALGEYAAARRCYEEAHRLHAAADDRRNLAIAHINLGGLAHEQGDAATAAPHLERALAVSDEVGDPIVQCGARWGLGEFLRDHGDCARARALLVEAVTAARGVNDRYMEGRSELALAGLERKEGDLPAADVRLKRAALLLEAIRDDDGLADVFRHRALVALGRGAPDGARAALATAEHYADAAGLAPGGITRRRIDRLREQLEDLSRTLPE